MKILIKICSEVFNVPEHVITQTSGKDRTREAVEARMVICKILKEEGYKLKRIAEILNYGIKEPDHGTVIYTLKAYDDLYETNPGFKRKANFCKIQFEARRNNSFDYEWAFLDQIS